MADIEIVARVERRRKWTAEDKAALMAELAAEGGKVSVVAQRHRIAESLLYNWRAAWKAAASAAGSAEFVPLGVLHHADKAELTMLPSPDAARMPPAVASATPIPLCRACAPEHHQTDFYDPVPPIRADIRFVGSEPCDQVEPLIRRGVDAPRRWFVVEPPPVIASRIVREPSSPPLRLVTRRQARRISGVG